MTSHYYYFPHPSQSLHFRIDERLLFVFFGDCGQRIHVFLFRRKIGLESLYSSCDIFIFGFFWGGGSTEKAKK